MHRPHVLVWIAIATHSFACATTPEPKGPPVSSAGPSTPTPATICDHILAFAKDADPASSRQTPADCVRNMTLVQTEQSKAYPCFARCLVASKGRFDAEGCTQTCGVAPPESSDDRIDEEGKRTIGLI